MTKTYTTVVLHGCTIPFSNLLRHSHVCCDIASASAGTNKEFKFCSLLSKNWITAICSHAMRHAPDAMLCQSKIRNLKSAID